MTQCTAIAKTTGQRCKREAVPGRTNCKNHGGNTLRGVAHPRFKHGKYSTHLPSKLSVMYEEALEDVNLLSVRDEIALTEVRLRELLDQYRDLEDDGEKTRLWSSIDQLFASRTRLAEAERKRIESAQRMVSGEQVMILMASILSVLRGEINDAGLLHRISERLTLLSTTDVSGRAQGIKPSGVEARNGR